MAEVAVAEVVVAVVAVVELVVVALPVASPSVAANLVVALVVVVKPLLFQFPYTHPSGVAAERETLLPRVTMLPMDQPGQLL